MNKTITTFLSILFFSLLVIPAFVNSNERMNNQSHGTRISSPGKYKGYSQTSYKEWVRSSQYVTVSDGTKIAVDIFRPSINGKPVAEPLPLIWTHTCYQRVMPIFIWRNDILHQFPWLQTVLKHGYIIAAADSRGTGASFGIWQGCGSPEESQDAYDLTEWFAAQPWCNGKIGMYGRSYLGQTQYMAARKAPPHLKAIFPEMSMVDQYSLLYPGGVFYDNFIKIWCQFTNYMNCKAPCIPVDEDPHKKQLKLARNEHRRNMNPLKSSQAIPYRDSILQGVRANEVLSTSSYFPEISKSGIPVYHMAGWYDGYPKDMLLCYNNLTNPQKIIIGPWSHTQNTGFDLAAEHLRWYDYWLKGIDNGIMKEPPIRYYVIGAPPGKAWRSSWQWPLPDQKPIHFYFQNGNSNSIQSVNDGLLNVTRPTTDIGEDNYRVNYTTTSGKKSRWVNLTTKPFGYPDMSANDRKGLTYTTPPLSGDLEIIGHPVLHLWISSTARDGDFFAYLEDVDRQNRSHYITEGVIRASHRKVSSPPFNYLDLPYHRSYAADVSIIPAGSPVELVFDLLPTAYRFQSGHRIRLTITCADRDNALTPKIQPPPIVTVYRNEKFPSFIVLPVMPPQTTEH